MFNYFATIKKLSEISNTKLHIMFIYFKSVFDLINREKAIKELDIQQDAKLERCLK